MNDPLADKKMAWWKRCLIWLVVLAALFVVGFRLTQHRWVWEPKPVAVVEAVETADADALPAEVPAEVPEAEATPAE
jgi:hypothetical protein